VALRELAAGEGDMPLSSDKAEWRAERTALESRSRAQRRGVSGCFLWRVLSTIVWHRVSSAALLPELHISIRA